MNQSFNSVFQFNKSTEISQVGNLPIYIVTGNNLFADGFPGIFLQLSYSQGKPLIIFVKVKDNCLNGLAFSKLFTWMLQAFTPGNVRDVYQSINIIFNADKNAKVGDIFDFTLNFGANGVFVNQSIPWIGFNLFHSQGNASFFYVNTQNDSFNLIAYRYHL